MTFSITIKTDNAAFWGGNCAEELIWILQQQVIPGIQAHKVAFNLLDSNGNKVGKVVFK